MSPDQLRTRFDEASARHFQEPILGRYQVQLVSHADWLASFDTAKGEVFPGDEHLDLSRAWSEAQLQRFDELNAVFGAPLQHNAILLDREQGDTPMAWCYGVQDMRATYYMAISAVHPAWRGRGIYPAWLARLLPLLQELGFREAISRHQAHNNAVLIPKLRAGFVIAAVELTPNYGLLVHLRYPFSEAIRAVYKWRVDARTGGEGLRERGILKSG